MSFYNREDIKVGYSVRVVEKENQRSNVLTDGVVEKILTNSKSHPHGIKVRLEDGKVGRVKEVLTK